MKFEYGREQGPAGLVYMIAAAAAAVLTIVAVLAGWKPVIATGFGGLAVGLIFGYQLGRRSGRPLS